jgi:ribonuclease D
MTNQELIQKAMEARLTEIDIRKSLVEQFKELDRRGVWKEAGFKSLRQYCENEFGYDRSELREVLIEMGNILVTNQMLDNDPAIQNRIDRLKIWRREKAKFERVAAYRILSNRTLIAVAQVKPQTLEELSVVNGIGTKKISDFGLAILAVLQILS